MSGTAAVDASEIGTRWSCLCPRCEHLEGRDDDPGQYLSAPRCPECGWPMNCVDMEVLETDD